MYSCCSKIGIGIEPQELAGTRAGNAAPQVQVADRRTIRDDAFYINKILVACTGIFEIESTDSPTGTITNAWARRGSAGRIRPKF